MIIKKTITRSQLQAIQKKEDEIILQASENAVLVEIVRRIVELEKVVKNNSVYVDNVVLPTASGSFASIQGVFGDNLLIQIGTETFGASLKPL